MRFYIRLALWNLWGNRKFSLFFILSLTMGLSGITLIDGFQNSINTTAQERSRLTSGGDIIIGGRRHFTEQELSLIHKILSKNTLSSTHRSRMYSMIAVIQDREDTHATHTQPNSQTTTSLTELVFIEPHYPLYGNITLETRISLGEASKDGPLAFVDTDTAKELGLKPDSQIIIGDITFTIGPLITQQVTSSSITSTLAPKVYLSQRFLTKTGLVQKGSSVWNEYFYALKVGSPTQELSEALKSTLQNPGISIRTHSEATEDENNPLAVLVSFLSLVSLVAFFMATLGTCYLFRNHLGKKNKDIATLIFLGLSPYKSLIPTLLELVFLTALSTLLTIIISLMAGYGLPKLLLPLSELGFEMQLLQITWLWIGSSICALSLCLPYITKQLRLPLPELLTPYNQQPTHSRYTDILWRLPTIVVFAALSYQKTQSWSITTGFLSTLLLATLLLAVVSHLFYKAIKCLPRNLFKPLSLRLAHMWIAYNPFYWHSSFLSLAGGIMLMTIIPLLQHSIQNNITRNQDAPELFFIDIQPEQIEPLKEILKAENLLEKWVDSPFILVDLKTINGIPFKRKEYAEGQSQEQRRARAFTNRSMRVTYRDKLSPSETVVAGRFYSGAWNSKQQKYPEISVSDNFAERIGVKLGDVLTFDVSGIGVSGKVTSLREVDWLSFQPNFFIQFQPNVLEDAPKTYIGVLSGFGDTQNKIQLQSQIVQNMPNISIMDIRKVVAVLDETINNISLALITMAILSVIIGFAIFAFNIHYTVISRLRHLSLLVAMGCTKPIAQRSLVMEYSILSIFAALSGVILALGVSYLLSMIIFDRLQVDLLHIPYLCIITFIAIITASCIAWIVSQKGLKQPLWTKLNTR